MSLFNLFKKETFEGTLCGGRKLHDGRKAAFAHDLLKPLVREATRGRVFSLTYRGEFTGALRDALAAKWEKLGLDVEQVSVQDVRYAGDITARYAEAQEAEIAKAKALNEQEAAKVEAETKVIEAQGEADANRVLSESLTPEVIQQHYIDALERIGAGGNLVVVPEGATPIVGR